MTDGLKPQYQGVTCRVFVNADEIYTGSFDEVPEKFRRKILRDLCEWSDRLGKTGLNELLYSHLSWYETMGEFCQECSEFREGGSEGVCTECSGKLKLQYVHDRDKNLDMIMTCIGMITRVEVIAD